MSSPSVWAIFWQCLGMEFGQHSLKSHVYLWRYYYSPNTQVVPRQQVSPWQYLLNVQLGPGLHWLSNVQRGPWQYSFNIQLSPWQYFLNVQVGPGLH